MRYREPETQSKPVDPIAISLALWLGAMVTALGVQHLAEQAASAAQNAPQGAASSMIPQQAFAAWAG